MRIKPTDENATPVPPSAARFMLTTIGDTTWRMFVPIVGLLLVGNAIDTRYHTAPLWMLIGVVMGSIIAGVLIKRQLTKGT